MKSIRVVYAAMLTIALGGITLASGGCSQVAAKKTGEIAPASFKADPSRMTEAEKKNYERLTGSKPAPAASVP